MRRVPSFAIVPLAALSLAAAPFFGPPSIKLTEVRGAPPVAGAVLLVEGHHHTDEVDPQVSGRAITMRGGQRVSRPITLTKYGEVGHYAVTRQWDPGSAWVLVFTIKQGEDGKHGIAESLVKVDAAGKVTGIDNLIGRNDRNDRFPRPATEAEISAALASLGVRAER